MRAGNKKNGFTLVEAMIVVLIFSFIVAAISGVLLAGNQSLKANYASFIVQQQGRGSLLKIARELRKASGVSLVSQGADSITYQAKDALGASYEAAIYLNEESGKIMKSVGGVDTATIAGEISGLAFYTQGNTVKIEVTSQKTVLGRTHTFTLAGRARVRNL